jgi:hypothetical protein
MGDGPVTHVNAHWHTGDGPDVSLAEEDPQGCPRCSSTRRR